MSDLDEILAIEKLSSLSPWSRGAFENEMRASYARPIVVVADETTRILGFLCFWLLADECQLLNIAVHPEHRRRGLGAGLMACLLETCREHRVVHCLLEVRPSNEAAIGLYRKFGFENFDLRKRYYSDTGEDALLMKWSCT